MRVALPPGQIAVGVTATVNEGAGITAKPPLAEPVQVPTDPITAYDVFGVHNVTVDPVVFDGNQVYVVAPLAVITAHEPAHTAVGLATVVMVGFC